MGANCSWCKDRSLLSDDINVSFPGGLKNRAGEKTDWTSLLEAFEYCDPEKTGFAVDKTRFAEVAAKLANDRGNVDEVWKHLDMDGNGAVNFPEFVEWAERAKVTLEVGLPGDDQGGISFPSEWTGPKDEPTWNKRIDITDKGELQELQEMMNAAYKKVWTRDRKATGVNKVPDSYILVKAQRSENYGDWKRYYLKRHMLAHKCSESPNFQKRKALTSGGKKLMDRMRLRDYCNEWALFHGTKSEAAEAICRGDFTMKLAGSATGTLYGKGTYFAESITKADEYAKLGSDGLCCMLVCRVVGGRANYTDEKEPNADALQSSIIKGEYDCVIGDREKCSGTFKEYVMFDADQVYVEYVLFYKRIYAQK